MTPNYLTLAEAANELSQQLERPVTERQVLAYGENIQISIFAKINRDVRLFRIDPNIGEHNEHFSANGSVPRLSSNAVRSLLLTGRTEYKERTSLELINWSGNEEWAIVVTHKIADGEIPPETTIADCRISQASIDKIVDDELLVAVLQWEGRTTDYNYWLNLAILTPHEAIMLLNFCHPQRPLNTFSKVGTTQRENYEKLEKELLQAERAQTAGVVPSKATPLDWYNWANKNNFNVPTQFNAILCKPQIESVQTNTELVDTRKKWEIPGRLEYKCRNYGNEFIQAQKNANKRKPSVDEIAKHVEKKLKDENCIAQRKDYWAWQTIKREALTGITGQKANGK